MMDSQQTAVYMKSIRCQEPVYKDTYCYNDSKEVIAIVSATAGVIESV